MSRRRNSRSPTMVKPRCSTRSESNREALYATRCGSIAEIRSMVQSVDRPVSVLAFPGAPTVSELAEAGVTRISVGSWFFYVAFGAVADAARELLGEGTYSFWPGARVGGENAGTAFTS
jgi:2-methylisocitrate lyase-like PEP mutase family enzyme